MTARAMHIAFEAARLIEGEEAMGIWNGECILDPDVDAAGKPFVVVSAEEEIFQELGRTLPDTVIVSGHNVSILLKSLTMRMN